MSRFDPDCRRCARLAAFLDDVRSRHPGYHCRPVAAFGDDDPRVLVVGLAPGMHGANATGRPFTGDYAGVLLYRTLHQYGFASAPESVSAENPLSKSSKTSIVNEYGPRVLGWALDGFVTVPVAPTLPAPSPMAM